MTELSPHAVLISPADLQAIQAVKDALDKAYPPLGPEQNTPPQQKLVEMVTRDEERVANVEDEVGMASRKDFDDSVGWLILRMEGIASRWMNAADELRKLTW